MVGDDELSEMQSRKFPEQMGIGLNDLEVPKGLTMIDFCQPLEKTLFAPPSPEFWTLATLCKVSDI